MFKAFVCTSLGLGRCAYECFFWRSYEKDIFFKNRNCLVVCIGNTYCSVVLIVLWVLASMWDIRYVSVVVCFAAFLVNDIYGYVSWQKMKRSQSQ